MNRDKDNKVPEWEEIAAISMAVQNIWLSCYVNNIGSYWSSSPLKDEYGKLEKLDINQRCLGSSLWVVMIIKNLQSREII